MDLPRAGCFANMLLREPLPTGSARVLRDCQAGRVVGDGVVFTDFSLTVLGFALSRETKIISNGESAAPHWTPGQLGSRSEIHVGYSFFAPASIHLATPAIWSSVRGFAFFGIWSTPSPFRALISKLPAELLGVTMAEIPA